MNKKSYLNISKDLLTAFSLDLLLPLTALRDELKKYENDDSNISSLSGNAQSN